MQNVCVSWICLSTVHHGILGMGLGVDLASEVRHFCVAPQWIWKLLSLWAEELDHGLFMVSGFGEHPVSFSRVVLSFSLLREQERWKGEWKYFREIHHMWFPLQESHVVIAEADRKSFCKRSDVTPSSVRFPEFLLKSQGIGGIFHIYPHHYI